MAKRYEITMEFQYSDGTTPNGVLQTTVKGRSAIPTHCKADREWLALKGHREISLEVFEVGSYLHKAAVARRAEIEV